MIDRPMQILLVEDNPGDARLIREMLADAGAPGLTTEWVPTLSQGLERLGQGGFDLVLLDLGLPDSRGLDTFNQAYRHVPDIPFVLLTGLDDETLALTAVRQGAQDYLIKGETDANTLLRAIRYATERKKVQEALRRAHDELEHRVEARTAELEAANRQLQEEIARRQRTEAALQLAHDNLELKVAMRTAELAQANQVLQAEIEERKLVEEALQRQREEQQIILDAVPAAIFYKDIHNRYIRVNRAYSELTGLPAEAIEGKMGLEIFPSQAESFWRDDLEVISSGQAKRNIIETIGTPKGLRWVQTDKLPYRDEKGNIVGIIGFSLDITERKQAEEALRESEARFRTIFEDAAIGISLANAEGRIINGNPAMQKMLGCAADELIGKTFMEITHLDDLEKSLELFRELLAGRLENYQLEKRFLRPDGQCFWARLTVSAVREAGRAPLFIIAMIEDITQHKQAQENLQESEHKLRLLASQLLTAQERERGRISRELHDELGQSLLVLKLQVSHIEKNLGLEQTATRNECRAMMRQLDQLVDEVRRLARDLTPTMVQDLGLSLALKRLVEDFSCHNDIQAYMDQEEGINELFPRETQIGIYRIFQESLTNIGKYARASRLTIDIKPENGQVSFLVADNGRGFDLEEVWGRDPSRRGLGLMAMEERTRMMGGTLEITSREGQGTRIAFKIPISGPLAG